MKLKAEVMKMAMADFKLFILRRPRDKEHMPTVSLQMPKDIALYLKN